MQIRRGGLEAPRGKFAHYFRKMSMILYQPHEEGFFQKFGPVRLKPADRAVKLRCSRAWAQYCASADWRRKLT